MKYTAYIMVLAALWLGAGFAYADSTGAIPKQPMLTDAVLASYPQGSLLTATSQQAADALHTVMAGRVSKESPVLVATMVQLDDLQKSSTLGRMIMQQIASRLSQYGYRIVESRLRQEMAIRPREGEFMLSREIAQLMQTEYSAQAVLVGSYVENAATVYCSLRLIRLDDSAVIAAYEYHLPNRGEVRNMLRMEKKQAVDVDPVWTSLARRQAAFTPNGVALPPVQKQGIVRRQIGGANTLQGGGFPQPQVQAGGAAPMLGPPARITAPQMLPAEGDDNPVLGPPDRVVR